MVTLSWLMPRLPRCPRRRRRSRRRLVGRVVLAGLADQGAQLLRVGLRELRQPAGQRVFLRHQLGAPFLGQVQRLRLLGRALVLVFERIACRLPHVGIQLPHELANVLHLAPPAFEVGDAAHFGQRIDQLVGQRQALHQVGAQGQQFFAELLQLGAFTLEIGAAGFGRSLELSLELEVQFAAFGDELTAHEVAFFWFA
jgi:hypothetical protein